MLSCVYGLGKITEQVLSVLPVRVKLLFIYFKRLFYQMAHGVNNSLKVMYCFGG